MNRAARIVVLLLGLLAWSLVLNLLMPGTSWAVVRGVAAFAGGVVAEMIWGVFTWAWEGRTAR